MPKITIRESDQTREYVGENPSNVVYIPGFSNIRAQLDPVYKQIYYPGKAVPPFKPTLCTTTDEFIAYFGEEPAKMNLEEHYVEQGDQAIEFSDHCYNEHMTLTKIGDPDPSWIIAYELISNGIPVLYERVNEDRRTGSGTEQDPYVVVTGISSRTMYEFLTNAFKHTRDINATDTDDEFYNNILFDKNEVDIKYVTTGGYPVYEVSCRDSSGLTANGILNRMVALCEERGDCIALIDHTNNVERSSYNLYTDINNTTGYDWALEPSDYAAMFTPWVTFGGNALPGSFAYLISLAESVKSSPNWLAIAGVTRGVVPAISGATQWINNSVANFLVDSMDYGGICINPITNIRNYGLTIWGNRTLARTTMNTEKALYYLNMRSLVCEVKKTCYYAAQEQMFEQNSDILWINFKAKVMATLDKMASSNGLSGYKIIKEPTKSKTEIKATIKLYPIYAVEAFDITIVLTNDDIEVAEE